MTYVGAAAADDSQSNAAARVLDLTNAERAYVGLAPLVLNSELSHAAMDYSGVLATGGCFTHTCGPVPDPDDRVKQAGYTGRTGVGENAAAGYATPETVVAAWMASPPHRANILSPTYTEIGIGLATGDSDGPYWTEDFGTR